ncbi:hypothetical protein RFI_38637, partial [Reticulomyxa filosa]
NNNKKKKKNKNTNTNTDEQMQERKEIKKIEKRKGKEKEKEKEKGTTQTKKKDRLAQVSFDPQSIIFGYLNWLDVMPLSRTCKYWCEHAFQLIDSLKPVVYHYAGIDSSQLIRLLQKCSSRLKYLDLTFVSSAINICLQLNVVVNDVTLQVISEACPCLRSLNLFNCFAITDQGLLCLLQVLIRNKTYYLY